MKIYLDYVFFINFIFDFILLFTTKILLKRNVIILGSFIGTFSIFILFISMPSFIFFLSKMFFGLIMVIITFKFKDIKYTLNNFFYLMILSIILGGFLYFLNIEAGYEHVGLIFYKTGKTLDIFILLFKLHVAGRDLPFRQDVKYLSRARRGKIPLTRQLLDHLVLHLSHPGGQPGTLSLQPLPLFKR